MDGSDWRGLPRYSYCWIGLTVMTSQIYAPEISHSSGTDLNVCLLKENEC